MPKLVRTSQVACLVLAVPAVPARAAGTVEQVAVSQAGYGATAYKVGYVVATDKLSPRTRRVVRVVETPMTAGPAVS